MRYYVDWWYAAIDTWMTSRHFWFKRFACRYIGKKVVQGHEGHRRTARKWRVIDGKTDKVIMTVERIDGEPS